MIGIILIALSLVICSCGSNGYHQIDDNKPKKIRLVSGHDSIITKISQIASDVEYIPLQMSQNGQIKAIEKIIARRNKIYVKSLYDLYCFDTKGHFLYSLFGKMKANLEEVITIDDFSVDSNDSLLVILSEKKILQLRNTDTGFFFIKDIALGRLSPTKVDFVPNTHNLLISSGQASGYELLRNVLINLHRDILSYKKCYLGFDQAVIRGWDSNIHFQSDDKLLLKERFNDTVFSINSESTNFIPYLILDSRISSTSSENIKDPNYYWLLPYIVTLFEVPRYLYFDYNFDNESHQVFYDKYDGIRKEVGTWNGFLKDNIGGGPDFFPEFCSEGKIFSWLTVRDLKKYVMSEDFANVHVENPNKQKDLEKLVISLKESDNPVLIIVTPNE